MVFRAIFALAERRPLGFAVGYGGAKTIAADAVVQRYIEGHEELDKRRLAVFLSFGFFQVGFVQYQLYVNAFTRLFPTAAAFSAASLSAKLRDATGMANLARQVLLDQLVYHPLCYFPVFYTCKEVIQSSNPASNPVETVRNAMAAYVPNALDDLKALWSIFVPVSIIQFSVMPMHLRVPFTATAGFVWCGILSVMRGKDRAKPTVSMAPTPDGGSARARGVGSAHTVS